jgi:hypothetical protein
VAEEGMKNDPRMFLFILNCGDDDVALSLVPGKGSKYADIPRAPGKYALVDKAKAGEFGPMFRIKDAMYTVAEPGVVDITRFDSSRLVGTFSFAGKQRFGDEKKIQVTGHFDFKCVGSASCGK